MSNEMEDSCKLQVYIDSHEFHGSDLSSYAAQAAAETLLRSWLGALGEDNKEPLERDVGEVIGSLGVFK